MKLVAVMGLMFGCACCATPAILKEPPGGGDCHDGNGLCVFDARGACCCPPMQPDEVTGQCADQLPPQVGPVYGKKSEKK